MKNSHNIIDMDKGELHYFSSGRFIFSNNINKKWGSEKYCSGNGPYCFFVGLYKAEIQINTKHFINYRQYLTQQQFKSINN
jgi:hypothetical protein